MASERSILAMVLFIAPPAGLEGSSMYAWRSSAVLPGAHSQMQKVGPAGPVGIIVWL